MKVLATGSWLTRERVHAVAAISGAMGAAMLLFLWLARNGTVDFFGQPVGSDFTAFWHAGRLANAGDALDAWNLGALNRAAEATHGVIFPTAWIYPPVFLLVFAPLAALSYLPALFVYQLLSLTLVGLTLHGILQDRRAVFVALASPLTPMVLAGGQNAFLTAALLGSGLLLLERRPGVAGGLLGGLLYKPQLGLIIAPLLLFTKCWRAITGGMVTIAATVAISLLLWGPQAWFTFLDSLSLGRVHIMEQGVVGFHKSASLFVIVRQWGLPIYFAYAVQALGILVAVAAVWVVRDAKPAVRAAVACAGAALSTPYLFDYDMAVVGIGAAFLYAEGRRFGFLSYERSALAFIWFVPWIARPATEHLALPLSQAAMILLLTFAVRRARSGHRHAAVDVQGLAGDVAGLPAR